MFQIEKCCTGDRSLFKAGEPETVRVASLEQTGVEVAKWVKGLCRQPNFDTHEICVVPVSDEVRSALTAQNIQSHELQPHKPDPGQIEPGVRIGSMRRIKGLEFKAVAMVIDGKSDDIRRLERYVAATRARERLLVVEWRVAWMRWLDFTLPENKSRKSGGCGWKFRVMSAVIP
jgi:hypothetical protein